MKTTTLKILILASTLSVATFSYATNATMTQDQTEKNTKECSMSKEEGNGKYHNAKKSKDMDFERLDLSELQKEQMKSIKKASKKQGKSSKLAQQAKMQSFMQATVFNEKEANSLIAQKQVAQVEKKLSKLKTKYQMYQLLTDKQKIKYNKKSMQRDNCSMGKKEAKEKHRGKKKTKNMDFEKLNLSEQQKEQMKSIMKVSKKQSESDKQAHKANVLTFMQANTFNEKVAKSLIGQKQTAQIEKKLAMLKIKHQMYQLLTDEQKAEYNKQPMKRNKN